MRFGESSTSVAVEITAKIADEPCNIEVPVLHETLLKMPAEKYLELFALMSMSMKIYAPILKIFLSGRGLLGGT